MWRILPAVSAALLVVTLASFSLYAVETERGVAARSFGYAGQAWRVIVVTGTTDDNPLSDALRKFCDESDASVAFSSAGSGVVTLYDPANRFRDPGGSLYRRLSDAGKEPAALLSTGIGGALDKRSAIVPEGVELLGTFDPAVQFDGQYPALVANLAAAPVHSGVFRFAGLNPGDEAALQDLFARQGAEVIRLDVEDPVTFSEFWSTLLGIIVVVFVLLSLLSALFVAQSYASVSRARLIVASLCGATRRDLRLLLVGRLLPLVAAGTLAGVAVTLVMVLLLRRAMLADLATIVAALVTALLACVAAWALTIVWITWSEGRKVSRALPR